MNRVKHYIFRYVSWASLAMALVCLLGASSANAQQMAFAYELKKEWPLALPKGSIVVVKIPVRFWQVEQDQRKDLKLALPFKDEKAGLGSSIAYYVDAQDVLDQPDWGSSGFPMCRDFTLTKIYQFKSLIRHKDLPYTEVELQSGNIYLRLHIAHLSSQADALNSDFQKLTASGNWDRFENSEDFRKSVFGVQEAKIFTGPMSRLSYGEKISLMNMACDGNSFATETYKGKTYFSVTLQNSGDVYNSNVVNSPARTARVINERIIDRVKTFKGPTQASGIDGLKFVVTFDYRNFVNEVDAHHDRLEIYLPLELLEKFVDADITSQQLIDGSIVLLNGNRIQVSLTAG